MIVGSDGFTCQVNADWAKQPCGWSFKEVGGVGVVPSRRELEFVWRGLRLDEDIG